jgi:hypothetical protein
VIHGCSLHYQQHNRRVGEVAGLADGRKTVEFLRGFFGTRAVRVVGVVALFVVVVILLFLILNRYVAPTNPGERKDLVLAMAQILGGTALLSGLYFTWRTLQVNREGQITDRFTRAIDQLGSDELEIRLGGIYALERIARDSEQDHWPIMEVLTAYVRQHTRRRLPNEGDKREVEEEPVEETGLAAPGPDIQAIMAVIRRRIRHFDNGEPEFIDLHGTHLQGANLYKAHLYGANLHGANLSAANLSAANLSGADLSGAHLEGANLWEAVLYGARLAGTHLEGANLKATQSLLPDQLQEAVADERTTLLDSLRTGPALASGSSYQVKPGDTLWKIAEEKYNDGNKWRQIHRDNNWILAPKRIQAGWWIWIR